MKKIIISGVEYTIGKQNKFKGQLLDTKTGTATEGRRFWLGKLLNIPAVEVKGKKKPNPAFDKLSDSDAGGLLEQMFNKPKTYSKAHIEHCRKVVASTQGF